ncbi:uncharacterized protein QC764_704735 [Podospora pseudoanserina]|uniref:Uncharacterized protein n=1 Tax=Podospora pseudoanserina TaxID=2609844 RepID=A0ABR0HI91_9PEZI|nr:hypothetical protein QC764_704735 [Podospora pseudoanserina]
MLVNRRKVATISGVRSKLERYCHHGDKMRENNLSQDELMLMCQECPNYCSLGKALRQRLLIFLKTEPEEAAIWKRTLTDKFPEWFDLPYKQEDVPQHFLLDWEIFKSLGWIGECPLRPRILPATEQRSSGKITLPDTQLDRLVAVNILVESLVRDRLKEERRSADDCRYVNAAVQTNGPSRGSPGSSDSMAQPPFLVASQAVPSKGPG